MLRPRMRTEIGTTLHLVSISPITSAAIREQGFTVAGEAERYTAEGLVEALVRLAATSSP
jgi:uroporphyrinogen-III synthase